MIRMTRWSVSIQSSLTPPYGTLLSRQSAAFWLLLSLAMHSLGRAKNRPGNLTSLLLFFASTPLVSFLNRVEVVAEHYGRLHLVFLFVATTVLRICKDKTHIIQGSRRGPACLIAHRWTAGASPLLLFG